MTRSRSVPAQFVALAASISLTQGCVIPGFGLTGTPSPSPTPTPGTGGTTSPSPTPTTSSGTTSSPSPTPTSGSGGGGTTTQSFVLIQPGTFTMGSPADELGRNPEETPHQVTLTRAFYMQTTEVTQGQWKVLMGNNPSYFQNAGDAAPAEKVSWYDAAAYANKVSGSEGYPACYTLSDCTGSPGLPASTSSYDYEAYRCGANPYLCTGYRLPTEAEWEYAYRAGTATAFYNGPITQTATGDPKLDLTGWYVGNSDVTYSGGYSYNGKTLGTHPVGQKQANAWGLYDMAGNVWEWGWDRYGSIPTDSVTDPQGSQSGSYRVIRGGSWGIIAQDARAATRFYSDGLAARSLDSGFRLVRSRL